MAACGGGGDGGEPIRTVTTVSVSSPTLAPKQGDTVQLTAVAKDQFGDVISGTTATWSSSAPAVATVSASGLLQALAGGTVTVTATISNVPGSLSLTVMARVTTSVTVSSPTQTLQVGEVAQLTAVARDQFGDVLAGKTAAWSTADSTIATVSSTGLVQALAPGAVSITATVDAVAGSVSLTVAPRTVASVAVSGPTSTPKEGDSVQLTATARDQFGNVVPGTTASWAVSDAAIAAVSATWLLQTYATGTVQATATIGGISGALTLTVSAIKVGVTVGAKEVVFDYTTDRCEDLDLPDQPARFVRAEDGSLVLIDGNAPRHYLSRGAGFDSLRRICSRPALVSADLRTAESYENWEWLWVVYREGSRWHALIHNEFHDAVSSTCRVSDP
ncbi:MAG: Ig-like domain-containing protein, partial [Burkholderiaceae bacterium]|nr:Ig-like domain-containing protein [Burkholderiaceae bacterium]